jgi:hypothetical protein
MAMQRLVTPWGLMVTLTMMYHSHNLVAMLLPKKATNLVRLAQSDPAALGSLFNLLDQLAGRLRNGHIIDVQAYNTVVPLGKENPGPVPLLGTLRAAPNRYNQ